MGYLPKSFYRSLKKNPLYNPQIEDPSPKKSDKNKPKINKFLLILIGFLIIFTLFSSYQHNKQVEKELQILTQKHGIKNITIQDKEQVMNELKRLDKLKEEEQKLLKKMLYDKNLDKQERKNIQQELMDIERELIYLKKKYGLSYERNLKILSNLKAVFEVTNSDEKDLNTDFERKKIIIKEATPEEKEKILKELETKYNISTH